MSVPDDVDDVTRIRIADDANQELLDRVIEYLPRLTVTMNYKVEVDKPRYLTGKSIRRSMQRAAKRTFQEMDGTSDVLEVDGCDDGNRTDDWPTYKRGSDGSVLGMELPWSLIFANWPVANPTSIKRRILQPPGGLYVLKRQKELHLLAAMLLYDFLRMNDVLELLRTSKHALRLVHTFALAFSGLLREALGEDELGIEKKARGGVIVDVSSDPLVASALFTTHNSVRPRLTTEERSFFLNVSHSLYVWYELERMVDEEYWDRKKFERA